MLVQRLHLLFRGTGYLLLAFTLLIMPPGAAAHPTHDHGLSEFGGFPGANVLGAKGGAP
jgi:hypothetical protein